MNQDYFNFLRQNCPKYKSQVGQDIIIDNAIFQKKTNGFFLDIGANDGVTFSNTYFFEKHRNWSGICIEPLPNAFDILKASRNSDTIKINACISASSNGETEFLQLNGAGNMLSCMKEYCSEGHFERMKHEILATGGSIETIKVRNININFLLGILDVSFIDLLSLDVEGGELSILESIDYSKVHINVIAVEENSQKNRLDFFLQSNGFELYGYVGNLDLIYVNKKFANV